MEKIGLIAGNGTFPLLFAREARSRGFGVTAVAHRGETTEELVPEVDSLTWVRVGQLGKMIAAFKRAGIKRAVMAGGINKVRSLTGVRPDWRGLRFLRRSLGKGDDALLRRLASEFESEGIEIVPSTIFLDKIVAQAGPIAGPPPPAAVSADISVGLRVLRALGPLDVGQSVVVEGRMILAVEAIEGTDAAIERGAALGRGRAVVVKAAKTGQDLRFDVPAVGPATIETMARAGAATLALEAGSTIILDGERFVESADESGVSVVGFRALQDGSVTWT
jgi:hypothetical protein